jgi:spore germination protein YaaH
MIARGAKTISLCLSGCILAGMANGAVPAAERPVKVAGWFGTSWNYTRGFGSFSSHADRIADASPFWFALGSDGSVTPYEPEKGNADSRSFYAVEPEVIRICREHRILLIPTIGESGGGIVRAIIQDPARRARHVRFLVRFAVEHSYNGLDLDYESLESGDRAAFTGYVTELSRALHKAGKQLSVTVAAQTEDTAGERAEDWRALGRAVDRLRIMAYDYREDSSDPGPVAPLPWFKEVLAFAVSVVPPGKIQMGVPTYGYDWERDDEAEKPSASLMTDSEIRAKYPWDAEDVSVAKARDLAARMKATVQWDSESNSPFFKYPYDGMIHYVWYEDGRCLPAKLDAVRQAGCDGIVVWHLGSEDHDFWDALGKVR